MSYKVMYFQINVLNTFQDKTLTCLFLKRNYHYLLISNEIIFDFAFSIK